MNRPKYCIASKDKASKIYWIMKKSFFGYFPVKTESFAGVRIQKTFTSFEEAKSYLQWYVLDKYLN
jgi:hypothetical protein